MTSQPLDGLAPYSGERATGTTPSLTTPLPKDMPLDVAMQIMQQQRLEAKKQEWARWVSTEYQRCRTARTPFERQWYLNLAFTAGKHYVADNAAANCSNNSNQHGHLIIVSKHNSFTGTSNRKH